MDKVHTCVIEKNLLVREGLKSLLRKSKFDPKGEVSSYDEILETGQPEYELIVLSAGECPDDLSTTIEALKSSEESNVRVVVLYDDLDREVMAACFSSYADGFLLKDISAQSLIASLELIMTGEKVFPTSLASIITDGWDDGPTNIEFDFHNDAKFSPRAIEIIRCLAAGGGSNKLIARKLGITEATVKVHLKAILRKLELENRTQVAIWAVNNGIKPDPEHIH